MYPSCQIQAPGQSFQLGFLATSCFLRLFLFLFSSYYYYYIRKALGNYLKGAEVYTMKTKKQQKNFLLATVERSAIVFGGTLICEWQDSVRRAVPPGYDGTNSGHYLTTVITYS